MSENSKIEWTDHTFNPWIGCTKISPGCANCYADAQDKFRKWTPEGWGNGKPRRLTSEANWREPLKWNRKALADYDRANPWDQTGPSVSVPRPRVFCASLADWLDDEVPIEWLARLLKLIHETPHLDWLLLTKRPENWGGRLDAVGKLWECDGSFRETPEARAYHDLVCQWRDGQVPANVWIGTTVEDQTRADERIPKLLDIPAKVRFLSCEPLLGPVDISSFLPWKAEHQSKGLPEPLSGALRGLTDVLGVDWVICGGESGPNARPMHPAWARSLRDQCAASGVPFLFKQWGEWSPRAKICGAGEDFQSIDPMCKIWPNVIRMGEHGKDTRRCENCDNEMGEEVFVQKVGKKRAGRILDGKEHNEFPV